MKLADMARRSPLVQMYWRIPLIAVLGAVLAFAGSFLVQPTYSSSTRLLIQPQDSTLLSGTGQPLSSQALVGTSDTSKTLAETYAAMATSRSVAEGVVDQLHLDAAPDSGVIGGIGHGIAWIFRCGKAFLSSGFCAAENRHEGAIAEVENGTTAEQLGSTAGSAAGLPGSYVLQISAVGTTAAQAQSITDAVAGQLVTSSANRFKQDAQQYQASVQRQVDAANADVSAKAAALATFRAANPAAGTQQMLTPAALATLSDSLLQARADLASTQAQLDSINASLAATDQQQTSTQDIGTGRSNTQIQTQGTSTAYTSLITSRDATKAAVAGLQARITALESEITGATTGTVTDQVKLSTLQQALDAATTNQAALVAQLQKATSNALSDGTELQRIDQAALPQYPIAPKRLMYLALGLLVGGLAGFFLTALNKRRRTPTPAGDGDGTADDDEQILTAKPAAGRSDIDGVAIPRELEGAGAGRGSSTSRTSAPARTNGRVTSKPPGGREHNGSDNHLLPTFGEGHST